MIKLEKTEVLGFEAAIRGMRNPMNSWEKSDSQQCKCADCPECVNHKKPACFLMGNPYVVGTSDLDLMMRLAKGGSVHAKYRRMITVSVDITAPLYWWKEFDTYKVGTVANSCSTMHKIADKMFTIDDFSHEHLDYDESRNALIHTIMTLNHFREAYINSKQDDERKKRYWWQMIQLLPSSYNQRRTVMLSYEVLAGIYEHRRNHKLDEWLDFCDWIENLPYSEVITCNVEEGA